MKILAVFAFYLLYWLCCYLGTGTDRKNLAGLRSYPDTVQQAVRKHPVLGKAAPREKSLLAILLGNLLLLPWRFLLWGWA